MFHSWQNFFTHGFHCSSSFFLQVVAFIPKSGLTSSTINGIFSEAGAWHNKYMKPHLLQRCPTATSKFGIVFPWMEMWMCFGTHDKHTYTLTSHTHTQPPPHICHDTHTSKCRVDGTCHELICLEIMSTMGVVSRS